MVNQGDQLIKLTNTNLSYAEEPRLISDPLLVDHGYLSAHFYSMVHEFQHNQ